MATIVPADMTTEKNSQILVNVEEAMADLLLVSYTTKDQKFQGVLLDSKKGNLPFGVYSLHPAFSKNGTIDNSDDKLHSVSQRFTYQEAPESLNVNKLGPKGKTQPRQKMTVRLRPRKVLCSNCQGICNDNSENVDVSKKRKLDSDDDRDDSQTRVEKKYLMGSMLIPKLSRLQPSEISSAIKGNKNSKNSDKSLNDQPNNNEMAFVSVPNVDCDNLNPKDDGSFSALFQSAKTLKICYGEGEGTVVKIPPFSGDCNEDSGVSCDISKPDAQLRAAKKALKRAKRQAKKNSMGPGNEWSDTSPKLLGALSPRNTVDNGTAPSDPLEKKNKHRVKNKKRSKVQKKCDENVSKCTESDMNVINDLKDNCLNQKLSISLRRLSSNSYECKGESRSDGSESDGAPDFPTIGPDSGREKMLPVSPGDIVWGKVVGFPWWPGRVQSVTSSSQAHVAWFASKTSQLMPCESLRPFLEDYKLRFNKKKQGLYKEAVKQASLEAKRNKSHLLDPLASPTQNVNLSPRPIDAT